MKTKFFTKEYSEKKWWIVDAEGKTLGRLATQIANILRGKHNPEYSPNADTGDFVVVVNADKITMSGNKWAEKTYYAHSLHFGGLKSLTAEKMVVKRPEFLLREAVKGMLPKNKLAYTQIHHLKAYGGTDHPHKAQNPQALQV